METYFEKKCSINTNEKLGRHVKAKQDLTAGECVLLEQPSLLMASNGEIRCQNCYKITSSYCQTCFITPLCEKCKQHYEYDCQKLATMTDLNIHNLKQHPDTYGLIKFLLLQENPLTQQHFLTILQAENHMEQRRNTPIWLYYSKNAIQPILQSGILNYLSYASQINEEFLQCLCGFIDVNSFEIRAPDVGSMKGVYVKGALLSHDCMANTCIAIDDKYCMKIYANRAIEAGEIVTNCYTNILLNTAERRKILREGKYFHCTCKRCEDPTELGSHMSTLICTNCPKGYMIRKEAEKWQCLDCKHQETNEVIDILLSKLQTEELQKPKTLKEMEIWLQKLEKIIHPQHYMIVDVKQNIAAALRNIINDISSCPGRKVYERKIDLCKDILKVLTTIAPDISRLKAIAIYELGSTWAEYNRMRYQEKELNKKDLRDLLLESDVMLRDSIHMLLYEPKETPEGKLLHSMMQELKYLQTDIKMLK
ncbi:SET domain-containing protein SmydA-8-like [Calliphora vicina]|uniref:SET domain-containing protein SmydA-8-like n=1 Tax=Calliphora vicina TaxID=7373 RepID=UPI00325BE07C